MSLNLEESSRVWIKVYTALINEERPVVEAFKALQRRLEQTGDPSLRFVPFSAADAVAVTGTTLVDVPCRIYGWFAQKSDTSVLAILLFDNSDAGFADQVVASQFQEANDTHAEIAVKGIVCSTALSVLSRSDVSWATESVEADAPNGFLVVGQ